MTSSDRASPAVADKYADEDGIESSQGNRHGARGMADRVQSLRLNKTSVAPGSSRRRFRLWGVIALLVIAGAVGWSWYQKSYGPYALAEVEAVTATLGHQAAIVLDASGYIIARETIDVTPSIPGKVIEVNFEEGDRVTAGFVLARLDTTQHQADLQQAEAALDFVRARLNELKNGPLKENIERARASLRQSEARRDAMESNFERAKELQKDGVISPMEYDTAESNFREAAAQVAQLELELKTLLLGTRSEQLDAALADVKKAEAAVEHAKYFVENAIVKAPIDGTVLERMVDVGEQAIPESLRPGICQMADLTQLEAEVDIPEQELAGVQIGQLCLITTEAFPDREYRGRVERFAPTFNRQRGVRRAKIKVDSPDEYLMPGMTCRVQILEAGSSVDLDEKLLVPAEAVVRSEQGDYVFVLDKLKCARREVHLGEQTDGGQVEVHRGLKSGEVVLLPGERELRDGQAVRPRARARQASDD